MLNLDLSTIMLRAIVLIITIPIHEYAHAYVAYRLGDGTAKYQGRLTLNPVDHFDLMGGICLILFGIGWAKPVPINPNNFKDRKKGMALSAAAGPISNLLIALVSMVLLKIVFYLSVMTGMNTFVEVLYRLLSILCGINISLAIFNLMPFPPFDGSRIFGYFLPTKTYFDIMQYERQIFFGILALLWLGILDGPLMFFNNLIYSGLDFLTGFVDIALRMMLM